MSRMFLRGQPPPGSPGFGSDGFLRSFSRAEDFWLSTRLLFLSSRESGMQGSGVVARRHSKGRGSHEKRGGICPEKYLLRSTGSRFHPGTKRLFALFIPLSFENGTDRHQKTVL